MSHKHSLEKLLDLSPLSSTKFITANFPLAPLGGRGTFGGTLVAQSLLASLHTIPTNYAPTSLHSYFLNAGNPHVKIHYHVESLRSGRNFIHKQVRAYQHEKLIFISTILFSINPAAPLDSVHYMAKHLSPLPPLQEYHDAGDLLQHTLPSKIMAFLNSSIEEYVDMYNSGPLQYKFPRDLYNTKTFNDALSYYVRVRDPITTEHRRRHRKITPANDPRYQYVAFAYLSDSYFLLALPYLRQLPLFSHQFSVSLDHTIHFHKRPTVNEYMLQTISAPRSNNDKHFLQSAYYDYPHGEIVASVAQEGYVVYGPEDQLRAKL